MEDFASETDSDYTSYWRDWVGYAFHFCLKERFWCIVAAISFQFESFRVTGIVCVIFRIHFPDYTSLRLPGGDFHFGVHNAGPQPPDAPCLARGKQIL